MDERALAPTRRRRGVAFRAATLLTLAAGVVLLAACGDEQPYSHIDPKTDIASDIQWLYKIVFWAAVVVFVGVQTAIAYTALRFRRRNDERPQQIHGNRTLEIVWTAIPAVVLLVLFIPTAQVLYDQADAAEEGDIEIDVYGRQWWWEVHYPDEIGVVTANEIHVPQGQEVVFNLYTNNVVHSFWVPQLSGKMDLVPGHRNRLAFTAGTVGEYWGECAEFCGEAHAWMRFRVIVDPPDQFQKWVDGWRQLPAVDANPETGDVAEAPAAFGVCLACHEVNRSMPEGVDIVQEGLEANAYGLAAGPNLTLFGCRTTIGAGVLENTPENLELWLKETRDVKPGTYMPNYYETGEIDDAAVDEIVTYLSALKPAGGCPAEQPVGGEVQGDQE